MATKLRKKAIKQHVSFYVCGCIFLVTAALFSGCAVTSSKLSESDKIESRVYQFMKARNDGQWDVVYDLLDKAYKKEVSKKNFMRKSRAVGFGPYHIENIAIDADGKSAKVKMRSDFSMMGHTFTNAVSVQRWLLQDDGEWYKKADSFKKLFEPVRHKKK